MGLATDSVAEAEPEPKARSHIDVTQPARGSVERFGQRHRDHVPFGIVGKLPLLVILVAMHDQTCRIQAQLKQVPVVPVVGIALMIFLNCFGIFVQTLANHQNTKPPVLPQTSDMTNLSQQSKTVHL